MKPKYKWSAPSCPWHALLSLFFLQFCKVFFNCTKSVTLSSRIDVSVALPICKTGVKLKSCFSQCKLNRYCFYIKQASIKLLVSLICVTFFIFYLMVEKERDVDRIFTNQKPFLLSGFVSLCYLKKKKKSFGNSVLALCHVTSAERDKKDSI